MSDWRISKEKIRAALQNNQGTSPVTSTDRLRELGYQDPTMDAQDAQTRSRHRDDLLLARSRRLPPADQESVA